MSNPVETISFSEKLVSSSGFKSLFREGMALVEETAAYLDGQGRVDSRDLQRAPALAYATESMRLTTRLMQIASWLLLQRAVNEGEMTQAQAAEERNKVKLGNLAPAPDKEIVTQLPEALAALITKSIRLQTRVRLLEEANAGEAPAPHDNGVTSQIDRLRSVFERRGG